MQKPLGGFEDFWSILQTSELKNAFLNVIVFKTFLFRYSCELCEAGNIVTKPETIVNLISKLFLCNDLNMRTPKSISRLLINIAAGILNFKHVNPNSHLFSMNLSDLIEPSLPIAKGESSWIGNTIKIASRENTVEVKWEILFSRIYLCFTSPDYCEKIQVLANIDISKPVKRLKDFEQLDNQLGDLIILHLVNTNPSINISRSEAITESYKSNEFEENYGRKWMDIPTSKKIVAPHLNSLTSSQHPLDKIKSKPKQPISPAQFIWHVNTTSNPDDTSDELPTRKKKN